MYAFYINGLRFFYLFGVSNKTFSPFLKKKIITKNNQQNKKHCNFFTIFERKKSSQKI